MGMPRDRKVIVGVLGLAVGGLLIDRFVLGPSDATASDTPMATASAGGPVASVVQTAKAKVDASLRETVSKMLESHLTEQAPALGFGPDQSWMQREIAKAPAGEPVPATTAMSGTLPGVESTPTLSLVMPTGSGGIAVIDGVRLQVGQTHPSGFRLIGVEARSVTIERNGAVAVLTLPSPGK